METKQLAIHVEGLNKVYRLYDHNRDRLIDSLGLARKKRYREHFALNNVDLDVYQGECVGIIDVYKRQAFLLIMEAWQRLTATAMFPSKERETPRSCLLYTSRCV